jgi:hypothetical protein
LDSALPSWLYLEVSSVMAQDIARPLLIGSGVPYDRENSFDLQW